jgi:hypothetical protein
MALTAAVFGLIVAVEQISLFQMFDTHMMSMGILPFTAHTLATTTVTNVDIMIAPLADHTGNTDRILDRDHANTQDLNTTTAVMTCLELHPEGEDIFESARG